MVGMGDDRGARGVVTAGARAQDGMRWPVSVMACARQHRGMVSMMAQVWACAHVRWRKGYSAGTCTGGIV